MRDHLAYLKYILRHKWYVFLECFKLGIAWQGITHDLSKFRPSEWFPYVYSFYNPDGSGRKKEDRSAQISGDFDYAWLHHQKRNPHHWQYWLLVQDEDEDKILEMSRHYVKEMLADWRGAGRAVGKPDTKGWYMKNKVKIKLHEETRAWVERELGIET